MNALRKPRIGLVLGSGSARGWAHVGVIRTLEKAGIRPDLVCGTSVGALVGAAYAAGELDQFEEWVRGLSISDVFTFMDVNLGSGLIKGGRLMDYFRDNFSDRPIEDLPMPFAAVSTSLQTGDEVWLREGSTVEAVRASIALPAIFTPVMRDGLILVDGGLVNPVPVSLARAMGAEVVIAVDLSSDILGRHLQLGQDQQKSGQELQNNEWFGKVSEKLNTYMPWLLSKDPRPPAMLDVITASINIMQIRISRSRLAGDPPDLLVTPRLSRLGLLDFHRAEEAIHEGSRAMEVMLPGLNSLLNE